MVGGGEQRDLAAERVGEEEQAGPGLLPGGEVAHRGGEGGCLLGDGLPFGQRGRGLSVAGPVDGQDRITEPGTEGE